jgi:hypothetical protein
MRTLYLLALFAASALAQEQPPTVFVATGGAAPYRERDVVMETYGPGYAYDRVTLMLNYGTGGATGDYVRTHGIGPGVTIARKTAVRCDEMQWGCWAHQIALGPGAKSALWIQGEDGAVVPNAIVVSGLKIGNAVIQYNAESAATGVFFRIFKDGRITAELTADGVLRVRKVEVME